MAAGGGKREGKKEGGRRIGEWTEQKCIKLKKLFGGTP